MSYITGLFGRGILESKSAQIHEREAAHLKARLIYKLLDFDRLGLGDIDLPEMLKSVAHCGFHGVNITFPFKQKVIPFLDDLSPEARLLEAVNTVVIRDGKLTGHNTDCYGFGESFRLKLPRAKVNSVLQLGAGGAGSALVYALLQLGAKTLYLSDPDEAKVSEVIKRFSSAYPARKIIYCPDPQAVLPQVDGVVQASPIGMKHHPGVPMETSGLKSSQWVVDIIYFPAETEFLRQARLRGCKTINGEGMVALQAAEAFRLFTGLKPNEKRMLHELK